MGLEFFAREGTFALPVFCAESTQSSRPRWANWQIVASVDHPVVAIDYTFLPLVVRVNECNRDVSTTDPSPFSPISALSLTCPLFRMSAPRGEPTDIR